MEFEDEHEQAGAISGPIGLINTDPSKVAGKEHTQ